MDEPRPNIAFNVKWRVCSGGPFVSSPGCSWAGPAAFVRGGGVLAVA